MYFRFSLAQAYGDDLDLIVRLVSFWIRFRIANVLTDFHAFVDPSEDCVLVVEPGSWANGDEELRAVGVRTSICHGYGVGSIVFHIWREFVLELVSPD
jgi:hypothetical protein